MFLIFFITFSFLLHFSLTVPFLNFSHEIPLILNQFMTNHHSVESAVLSQATH